MLWADYGQYTSYLSFKIEFRNNRIIKHSNALFIKYSLVNFIYGLIYLYFILSIFNFDLKLFYINEFIFSQIQLFTLFYIFIIFALFKFMNQLSKYTTDLGFFFVQTYYMIILLLVSNNLLNVFLVLEVINVLIIYSFFITPTLSGVTISKVLFQDN